MFDDNEIVSAADTDPALRGLLLKLHKGATAAFTAKTTAQVLALFPGWSITKATFVKPSDEARLFHIGADVPYDYPAFTSGSGETFPRRTGNKYVSMHAFAASRGTILLTATAYGGEVEARMLRAEVAKYEVNELPDPKKAKDDGFYVMNLSDPFLGSLGSSPIQPTKHEEWMFSFDLFRKCRGHTITAPDGQTFDVCGPVQVLGFGGTKDFAAFFNWALANTNLEELVNGKLGLSKHVKASERPRVPVGGQTIGTCAICSHAQVVRSGVMVTHGYSRPGYGYIVGECFGVGYQPYETSAEACVAYIPHLQAAKTRFETRLTNLRAGKVTEFSETKRNFRTMLDEVIVIAKGHERFDGLLKSEIINVEHQIKYVNADIAIMQAAITNWKPGTLRRNEGGK